MSKSDRRVLGEINGVPIVERHPDDHLFAGHLDGDRPGELRIRCTCGWASASAPGQLLDLDVHLAAVNGVSYEEQKHRTAQVMRRLGIAWPDPKPMN